MIKKIGTIILCLWMLCNMPTVYAANELVFIYLNGSNTNDEKSKDWFIEGIEKFHPYLKKEIEQDAFTNEMLLKNGAFTVRKEPSYLYWGDSSKSQIEALLEDIDFLKFQSPKTAQLVRRYIALCLHDAIWISKFPSMYPVLENLHKMVMDEYKNGNRTVLLGYSAGTFITQQYFLIKLPVIDFSNIQIIDIPKEQLDVLRNANLKPTCLDAIFRARLVTYDIIGGLVANPNYELFETNINKLDDYTDCYCAPKDSVLGIINYASPIPLFYSDMSDPKYKINEVGALMYQYVVENGLFWLTVNYSDDPLGFPLTRNLTIGQVEQRTGLEIEPEIGFFYDKSNLSSRRTFLLAHISYWSTGKRYAKIVTSAFEEGYNYFHKIKAYRY